MYMIMKKVKSNGVMVYYNQKHKLLNVDQILDTLSPRLYNFII